MKQVRDANRKESKTGKETKQSFGTVSPRA